VALIQRAEHDPLQTHLVELRDGESCRQNSLVLSLPVRRIKSQRTKRSGDMAENLGVAPGRQQARGETAVTEEALFHEALAQPPAERAAFLDAACAGQLQLRAAVEALLAAHEASGSFLDRPPLDPVHTVDSAPGPVWGAATGAFTPEPELTPPALATTTDYHSETGAGSVIAGRYTLQEKIGEGGMGEVWIAKQTEPVKRKVALKLIKTGMDSKAVLTRFEQERQALALMDHPNIARVLDGGMTPTGQPFFVMELVNGLSLTKFCDDARLTPRQRLELFVPICAAVQHAHHKGIVHRDLKPANILVTLLDGKPMPKVIDFGVAKATAGKLTDESLSTQLGAVVGTLEYMSPEQAGFTGEDIDTRADIYSLGVILYELLTGLRPIDVKRLRKAALTEMIRIIREEEPPLPSTRLSTDDSLPSLAALRQTEPKKLMALLRGELDCVVMKCLQKQRERRYETANALARDVERYLADELVEARPPSAGYRLGKFLKRHKGPVVAASLVLFALLAGILGTTWGWFEARQQEQEAKRQEQLARNEASAKEQARAAEAEQRAVAEKQKEKALQAAEAEKAANDQAQKRLKQIEQANAILGSIFENLDPKEIARNERPLQAILVEQLDRAVAQLEGESIGDPLVVAAMQAKFGKSLLGLGEPGKAIVLLDKAVATQQAKLGPDHPDTLASMNNLASAHQEAGKLALALPLFVETLKLRQAKLGPDHVRTLASMGNLASAYQAAGQRDLALPLFEETLKLQKAKIGPNHPDTLRTMNNLALAYQDAGKLALALPLFEETLEHFLVMRGPDHPETLASMNNLALAYQAAGKSAQAVTLFEKTLKHLQAKLGPEHPSTLASMNNLAATYHATGKLALALPLFEETLKLRKAKLGSDHPDTLITMNNLAVAYQDAGKVALAVPLLEETLKHVKTKLGPEHPSTLSSTNNLAAAYLAVGELTLALPLLEETLKLTKAKLGPDHPDTLGSMNNLALAYWKAQQLDKSIPLFEETLRRLEAMLGRDHPNTLMTVANLGVNYQDAGRLKEAMPLLEEVYRAAKKYPALRGVGPYLLEAYVKAGENAKFANLLEEQLPEARKALPKDSPQLASLLAQFGAGFLQQRKWAEAEPLLRECLAIRDKTQPGDWRTFNTQSMLGEALLGQKKYQGAEPLLLAGYQGMKEREKTIPPQGQVRLTEAALRLVQLYEATGSTDEAAKWRKTLESIKAANKKVEQQP
jgi:tetratricopeptide (TPR) repeat protein/tRNA A-37 threonylcarbamoyl transferase component Bud32